MATGGAQRITFEFNADSAPLLKALESCAASLNDLAAQVVKTTARTTAAGEETIGSNRKVAASFTGMAAAATDGAEKVTAAMDAQVAAVNRAAARAMGIVTEAEAASGRQVAASERTAEAANVAADEQVAAADRVAEAQRAGADTAAVEADRQKVASERIIATLDAQSVAALRAGTVQREAAVKSSAAFGAAGSELSRTGKTMLTVLSGVAAGSVYMASKFQASTLQMQTQAGATTGQLEQIRKGILAMAGQVGDTPNQLSQAMYHVVSSMNAMLPPAQRASAELHIMKIAAEGAQIGGSNLEDTTYALASAMNALHSPADRAQQVMGILNGVVGAGDMHMQDLVDALRTGLIPTAEASHVTLKSLGAALATLGDMGQQGALAGTRLRMAIALLSGPSEAATKVLDTVGLSAKQVTSTQAAMAAALEKAGLRTTQLSADLRQPDGILVALRDLNAHLRSSGLTATGAAALMDKAFGGARTGETITELAQNTDRLNAKFLQIGRTSSQFGSDWAKTSDTLRVQLDKALASVESLGISIGTALTPFVEVALKDFGELAHWLEQNKVVLDSLAIAATGFATVTIGSFLVSKLKGAISLITEARDGFASLYNGLQKWGSAESSIAAKATGTALPGAGGVQTAGAAFGIGGVRSGFGLPGSQANPIVVAIEAGEYTGLGSEAAVVGQEGAKAATVGEGAAAAAATEATAAETAAGAGMLATLKSGLGSVLAGAMKGAGVAGMGVLGSQLAGGVIGGQAGKDVSKVGTFASIGAGAGSVVPGVGTLTGAALGGLAGALDTFLTQQGNQYGDKLAKKLTAPLGTNIAQQYEAGIASALNSAHASMVQAQSDRERARSSVSTTLDVASAKSGYQTPQAILDGVSGSVKDATAQFQIGGLRAADAFIKSMQSVKFPNSLDLIAGTRSMLETLPKQSRDIAAETMVGFAKSLQDNGELPKNATAEMIKALEAQFPDLTTKLGEEANKAAGTVAGAMRMDQALANTQAAVKHIGDLFGQTVTSGKLSSGQLLSAVSTDYAALAERMGHFGRQGQQDASDALAQLRSVAASDLQAMLTDSTAKMQGLAGAVQKGSSGAASAVYDSFSNLQHNVFAAMSSGLVSAQQGAKDIAVAMNAYLKALGQKPIPINVETQTLTEGAGYSTSVQRPSGYGLPANATGGFIGNAGERGRDQVPVVLGRGEAVLNHQQQAVVNQYVPGGLPAVFSQTAGSKHYMASGGFAGIHAPSVSGTGSVADIVRASLKDVAQAASQAVQAAMGSAAGSNGVSTAGLSGSLIQVVREIAKRKGWGAADIQDWLAIIQHESGGSMTATNPYSGAYGLAQMNTGTGVAAAKQKYYTYGGDPNTLQGQLVAMANYIAQTYVDPARAWAQDGAPGSAGYAEGGLVGGAIADILTDRATIPKPPKPTKPKAVNKPKAAPKGLGVKDLQDLAGISSQLLPLDTEITNLSAQLGGLQLADPALEQQPRFLNSDGTANQAGIAQQISDDQTQLAIAGQIFADYWKELPIVTAALTKYLGAQSTLGGEIKIDTSKIAANRMRIAANAVKEKSLRDAIFDLSKPTKNQAQALEDSIAKVKVQYDPQIHAAENAASSFATQDAAQRGSLARAVLAAREAKDSYTGTNSSKKKQLSRDLQAAQNALSAFTVSEAPRKLALEAAVRAAKESEQNALGPLQSALVTARIAAQKHSQEVKAKRFSLGSQLNQLTTEDTNLRKEDTDLASTSSGLKSVLSGSGSGTSTNTAVSLLERIAASLGTVEWDSNGRFVGIDSTNQGAAFNLAYGTILPLQNQIAQLQGEYSSGAGNASGSGGSAGNSVLDQLLQQQNLVLSNALAAQTGQESTIAGLLSQVTSVDTLRSVGSFAHGGPILSTGMALVHRGEWITPDPQGPYGRQMSSGGTVAAPSRPGNVAVHVHGDIGPLVQTIRAEIDGRAATVVSQQLGRRQHALFNAPGRPGLR